MRGSLVERFWSRVNKKGPVPSHCPELGPCWIWTAGRDNFGYGQLGYEGRTEKAHRVAYLLEKGVFPPKGICVLHHCDNPACVRRSHHFEGTKAANNADKAKKKRCKPAVGLRHGTHTHPEKVVRGDAHHFRKDPTKIPRGNRHGRTKIPDEELPRVHALFAQGLSKAAIAKRYAVDPTTIYSILTGRNRKAAQTGV